MMFSPCHLIEGATFSDGLILACRETGIAPTIATLLALSVIVAVVARAILPRDKPIGRALAAALIALAAVAAAFSSARPVLHSPDASGGGHLIALVDVSGSMTREQDRFDQAFRRFTGLADQAIAGIPPGDRGEWQASVVAFAGSTRRLSEATPIDRLQSATLRAGQATGLTDGSNLADALGTALDLAAGEPAIAFLLSDGKWTAGETDRAIDDAIRAGLPVSVLAGGSTGPDTGLIAADLADVQTLGASSQIRMVTRGKAFLHASVNGDSDGDVLELDVEPDPNGYLRPGRLTVNFPQRGIQFVRMTISDDDVERDRRDLFATVRGPARVAIFGPAPWADALPPERFQPIRRSIADGLPETAVDAVVIDGVPNTAFAPDFPEMLAARVAGGTGLFLINGAHKRALTEPTNVAGWEQTAIGSILPVNSDGRTVLQEHPPREVIIIIDASGSMHGNNGDRIGTAKRLAEVVIDALRPVDKVEVVEFRTDMKVVQLSIRADADGKRAAKRSLKAIVADGGTDPSKVLQYAAKLQGNYCGIFFISDGDFSSAPNPPGCFTTVFEVNDGILRNPQLKRLGDVKSIRVNAPLKNVELKYFEPEPRTETFRPGVFRPRAVSPQQELTPPLDISGVAISYPRVDAERISVHPDIPPDPVVAFRRDIENPLAQTMVFMSEVPHTWVTSDPGMTALSAYLDRLIGWSDPDRHLIQLKRTGDRLELSLTYTGTEPGDPPGLSASVASTEGDQAVRRTSTDVAGRYTGTIRLPQGEQSKSAVLEIKENGEISQRVPIILPGATGGEALRTSEAWTWGTDQQGLRELAIRTGGAMLDQGLPALGKHRRPAVETPIHPAFVLLSIVLFGLGLWVGGGRY